VSAVDTLEVLVISKALSTSELMDVSKALTGDVKPEIQKQGDNVGVGVVARAEVVTFKMSEDVIRAECNSSDISKSLAEPHERRPCPPNRHHR